MCGVWWGRDDSIVALVVFSLHSDCQEVAAISTQRARVLSRLELGVRVTSTRRTLCLICVECRASRYFKVFEVTFIKCFEVCSYRRMVGGDKGPSTVLSMWCGCSSIGAMAGESTPPFRR